MHLRTDLWPYASRLPAAGPRHPARVLLDEYEDIWRGSRYYKTGPGGEKPGGGWRFLDVDEPRSL